MAVTQSKVKGKLKMMLWIDLDVYEAIMNAKTKYSRKHERAVRQSKFIEESIFKPYLKAGGFLK